MFNGDLAVLPRDRFTFDVFVGEDWKGHRVFRIENGNVRLVRGLPLTKEQYSSLCDLLMK